MVAPQVYQSILKIVTEAPTYYDNVNSWIGDISKDNPELGQYLIPALDRIYNQALSYVNEDILPNMDKIVAGVTSGIVGGVKLLLNVVLAVIVSVYVMTEKEILISVGKKLTYSLFERKNANAIVRGVRYANQVFGGFINGKIIDSFIIGAICYVFMVIADFHYPVLISMIIGIISIPAVLSFGPLENFKILDSLLDFAGLTESGKIIIFEFKKNTLRTKDLKQVYDYYRQVYCKEKTDVISIIIVISKYGEVYEYSELDITFHPQIIKTKEINKQEDLKIIRDKFRNNHKLTSMECTLLSTFPLFDIGESESQIIEEVCTNIKNKKHCIPNEEMEQIVRGMYLNMLEYIDPEKQETLMEMIGVEDIRQRGDFAKIRKAKRENIEKRAKKEIIEYNEGAAVLTRSSKQRLF